MKIICENRKARYDYFIEEDEVAGIVLQGWEVKSIRAGKVQIGEAHIIERNGELLLFNSNITPLVQHKGFGENNPTRSRKLLMTKRQIEKWSGKVSKAGYTIVPLNMHFANGKVKVKIGLAKGKKQYDKRQTEKERTLDREAARGE